MTKHYFARKTYAIYLENHIECTNDGNERTWKKTNESATFSSTHVEKKEVV